MESRSQADSTLSEIGSELADAVIEAVPGWIEGCVRRRSDEWTKQSGNVDSSKGEALDSAAHQAGQRAADAVAEPLTVLLSADVDAQSTTPLSLVRPLVSFAAEVLRELDVPPIERDEFEVTRFPDDVYGLTPVTLGALGEDVGNLALAWGAAKAMAHRRRHQA
jgi:hypothetical protein